MESLTFNEPAYRNYDFFLLGEIKNVSRRGFVNWLELINIDTIGNNSDLFVRDTKTCDNIFQI